MQEIKKRRIVLASVLKPVDDTRMFEKLGRELSPYAEVSIIGYPSAAIPETEITFYPLKHFQRLSLGRVFAPWRILFKLWQLRPDALVVTTHELLFAGCVLKALGSTLYYDVQENYYLNILHTNAFPRALRGLIANYVRMKEKLFAPFVDRFILAEKIYFSQLAFTGSRAIVIENKAAGNLPSARNYGEPVNFLFTGTLAETTGVFEAIRVIELLREIKPAITLTIAGYAPSFVEFRALCELVKGKPHIRIVGGDRLVPHQQILQLIRASDVGLISYQSNPATEGRRPTKLFEYLAFRLPILASAGTGWTELMARYEAGVVYDPADFNAAEILQKLSKTTFYPTFPAEATWQTEVPRLLEAFGLSRK